MKTVLGIIVVVILALGGYMLLNTESKETVVIPPPKEENKVPALPDQVGLPREVEATRQAIYVAALSRDYDRLTELATYPNFSYSFGGPHPGGFLGYLKQREVAGKESPFDIIPTLLRLPYGKSGGIYAWPGVFYKKSSEWTEEDVALMRTFLSDEQIESFRKFGGYIYYRVGINENGDWIFYIAGD